jgi:hypothetical protein
MDARVLTSGSRPWFAVAVVLCGVGLALGGGARNVLVSMGGIAFLLACTRYIALAVRDDPVRSRMVARETLLGTTVRESGIAQRRRAAKRATRARRH